MASKEQKSRKQFAEKLLRIKGINYDEWLDSKHQEVIQENQDVVMQALEMALEVNDSSSNTTDSEPEDKEDEQQEDGQENLVSNKRSEAFVR